MKKVTEVEVLKPVKLALNANLKGGGDAAAAKQLNKLYTEAQTGMRRIVALGLFAWELKETKLKHGEFGTWLAEHCPKLAAVDSVTGKVRPSRALSGYMDLTKNVLESVGFDTVEKYLAVAAEFPSALSGGKFLLVSDKKAPDSVKPLREKIFELVDGKTQRALFSQFKQAEEDDEGQPKVHRGRLKGQGGATAAQRAAAQQAEEEGRILELTENIKTANLFELEIADAKGLGTQSDQVLKDFILARETSLGYARRVLASRTLQSATMQPATMQPATMQSATMPRATWEGDRQ